MHDVVVTDERADRPADFELADAWRMIADDMEQLRTPVRVRALADAWAMPWLRWAFGSRLGIGPAADDGRVEIEIRGHTELTASRELAPFGARVEVVEPPGVRGHLVEYARATLALRAQKPRKLPTPRE